MLGLRPQAHVRSGPIGPRPFFFQIFFSNFFFFNFFFNFFFFQNFFFSKLSFPKYIAPYASGDNQFRRDPNFQIFVIGVL